MYIHNKDLLQTQNNYVTKSQALSFAYKIFTFCKFTSFYLVINTNSNRLYITVPFLTMMMLMQIFQHDCTDGQSRASRAHQPFFFITGQPFFFLMYSRTFCCNSGSAIACLVKHVNPDMKRHDVTHNLDNQHQHQSFPRKM